MQERQAPAQGAHFNHAQSDHNPFGYGRGEQEVVMDFYKEEPEDRIRRLSAEETSLELRIEEAKSGIEVLSGSVNNRRTELNDGYRDQAENDIQFKRGELERELDRHTEKVKRTLEGNLEQVQNILNKEFGPRFEEMRRELEKLRQERVDVSKDLNAAEDELRADEGMRRRTGYTGKVPRISDTNHGSLPLPLNAPGFSRPSPYGHVPASAPPPVNSAARVVPQAATAQPQRLPQADQARGPATGPVRVMAEPQGPPQHRHPHRNPVRPGTGMQPARRPASLKRRLLMWFVPRTARQLVRPLGAIVLGYAIVLAAVFYFGSSGNTSLNRGALQVASTMTLGKLGNATSGGAAPGEQVVIDKESGTGGDATGTEGSDSDAVSTASARDVASAPMVHVTVNDDAAKWLDANKDKLANAVDPATNPGLGKYITIDTDGTKSDVDVFTVIPGTVEYLQAVVAVKFANGKLDPTHLEGVDDASKIQDALNTTAEQVNRAIATSMQPNLDDSYPNGVKSDAANAFMTTWYGDNAGAVNDQFKVADGLKQVWGNPSSSS